MKYKWQANSNKTQFSTALPNGVTVVATKKSSGEAFEVNASASATKAEKREGADVTLFAASFASKDIAHNAESIDDAADKAVARVDAAKAAIEKAGLVEKK